MKNLHFKSLSNDTVKGRLLLSYVLLAATVFACRSEAPNPGLYPIEDFRISQVNFEAEYFLRKEFLIFRHYESEGVFVFNLLDNKILKFEPGEKELIEEFNFGDSIGELVDVFVEKDRFIIMNKEHELFIWDRASGQRQEVIANASIAKHDLRVLWLPDFGIEVEQNRLFIPVYNFEHKEIFLNDDDINPHFSSPIELRYDLTDKESRLFGMYPAHFRLPPLEQYNFLPKRQRLKGRSYYGFSHVDSLYSTTTSNGTLKRSPQKSLLGKREFVPFDKDRGMDYSYIWDYDFLNDQYIELIADPYRDLIYSVFRPGIAPPEQKRLSNSDVTLTIMVFDADLNFIKEVFIPPGKYDPHTHFVAPEGLCLQTVGSEGKKVRVFDVFDLTMEGQKMEASPENLILMRRLIPIGEYLRDSLEISPTIDSVVVISGLGCTGCLESMIMEAESKAENLNRYALVAGLNTSRVQTIADFLSRYDQTYIDSANHLMYYRDIGDFLTLVVLDGDSVVAVDDKFGF